ncbi:hypothetical protein SAMN06272755_0877 [Picosynechococcus sp. OG1]|nr:hypothetical protein SAMN06272755_0877 [Picosynechococcus sp. OG1]SMQ77927.1 hypothetical protein SAMN06272774_0156 [Synechococcus sp. 7002]
MVRHTYIPEFVEKDDFKGDVGYLDQNKMLEIKANR